MTDHDDLHALRHSAAHILAQAVRRLYPQVKLAGLVQEAANATWGPHKVLALPVHLSRTPARVEHAAPMTGEHTRETLEGLGYDTATIDALIAAGVIQQHGGGQR